MAGEVVAPVQPDLVHLVAWIILRYTWFMKDLITFPGLSLYVPLNDIYYFPRNHSDL